jgi:hypothetical protein
VPDRVTAPNGGTYAFRCGWCTGIPAWRVLRRGDAEVTWACARDLDAECCRLQRDGEVTELVVTHIAISAVTLCPIVLVA